MRWTDAFNGTSSLAFLIYHSSGLQSCRLLCTSWTELLWERSASAKQIPLSVQRVVTAGVRRRRKRISRRVPVACCSESGRWKLSQMTNRDERYSVLENGFIWGYIRKEVFELTRRLSSVVKQSVVLFTESCADLMLVVICRVGLIERAGSHLAKEVRGQEIWRSMMLCCCYRGVCGGHFSRATSYNRVTHFMLGPPTHLDASGNPSIAQKWAEKFSRQACFNLRDGAWLQPNS